jgi:hypothetical protein
MARYVYAFRNDPHQTASPADEEAWTTWFGQLGDTVIDFGNRVSRATMVGGNGSAEKDALSGYVVVNADSLEAAAKLAQGCPGLQSGGRVEVGEIMEM